MPASAGRSEVHEMTSGHCRVPREAESSIPTQMQATCATAAAQQCNKAGVGPPWSCSRGEKSLPLHPFIPLSSMPASLAHPLLASLPACSLCLLSLVICILLSEGAFPKISVLGLLHNKKAQQRVTRLHPVEHLPRLMALPFTTCFHGSWFNG